MVTWIKSVLPRVTKYAINLDKTELLVDKTWIWHEFQDGHSTFHFLRDGRLLITRSGNVEEGLWELIPGGLLHIKGTHFNYMFNHGIVFEGVLLIKKQGIVDNLEIFYDEAIIPNGDFIRHIDRKLNEKNKSVSTPPLTPSEVSGQSKYEVPDIENSSFILIMMVALILLFFALAYKYTN